MCSLDYSARCKSVLATLAAELDKKTVVTDTSVLAEYSKDRWAMGNPPAAVFFPESVDVLSRIVSLLYINDIPMVPRGAGSGMTGGAIPLDNAVVISLERMNRIVSISKKSMSVVVEPGVILEDLQQAVESEGLFYPPDPASADIASIGGNIAENSGGLRCVKYGVTGDYVLSLEAVMPDGRVVRFGSGARKDVAGFDLKRLLIGSEGMLAFVTQAELKLLPLPEATSSFKLFFESSHAAMRSLSDIFMAGIVPAKAEFIGYECLRLIKKKYGFSFPERARSVLLISLDGSLNTLREQHQRIAPFFDDALAFEAAEGEQEQRLWELRTQISPSLKEIAPVKINEDVSVPLDKLAQLSDYCEQLSQETGLTIAVFGHAGDGNLHVNFMIQPDQYAYAEEAVEKLFRETVRLGGTITGEHGIGIAKAAYAELSLDPQFLQLCRDIKTLFDPKGLLNPGKAFYGSLAKHHVRERLI